jgi:hypothetical protein
MKHKISPSRPAPSARAVVAEKLLNLARYLRRRGSAAEAKVAATYEEQFERDLHSKAA